jgi:hypothetical protein
MAALVAGRRPAAASHVGCPAAFVAFVPFVSFVL